MTTRPGVVIVGESLLVGAAVSVGGLAMVVQTPLGGVVSPLRDVLVLVWFAVICLGSLSLGRWRAVPTVDLIGAVGWVGGAVLAWLS